MYDGNTVNACAVIDVAPWTFSSYEIDDFNSIFAPERCVQFDKHRQALVVSKVYKWQPDVDLPERAGRDFSNILQNILLLLDSLIDGKKFVAGLFCRAMSQDILANTRVIGLDDYNESEQG